MRCPGSCCNSGTATSSSRDTSTDLLGQEGYFNPLRSRWIDTLFSSWHGFLSWSPVAYLAVIGTVAYLRREWRWAAATLAILFLTAWVNGATQDWAGGWSFGGRRFCSALVMLAPGLAMLVQFVLARPLVALAPLVVAALWWNHLLMVQYAAGMLPKDEPVAFGRIVRQQAELQTRAPYWYPFAFPANVWFAWREGVPVDKYDVLSPETPGPSFSLTFDCRAERFLLNGWDVPGGDDWGPSWWIGGCAGDDGDSAGPRGRRRDDSGADTHTLRRATGPGPDGPRGERARGGTLRRGPARCDDGHGHGAGGDRAGRLFRRGFNEIAFRSLGVERVDPADTRQPGPLANRKGSGVWPVAVYEVDIRSGTLSGGPASRCGAGGCCV